MNGRLVEFFKRCESKSSETEKEECFAELDELAEAGKEPKN